MNYVKFARILKFSKTLGRISEGRVDNNCEVNQTFNFEYNFTRIGTAPRYWTWDNMNKEIGETAFTTELIQSHMCRR